MVLLYFSVKTCLKLYSSVLNGGELKVSVKFKLETTSRTVSSEKDGELSTSLFTAGERDRQEAASAWADFASELLLPFWFL